MQSKNIMNDLYLNAQKIDEILSKEFSFTEEERKKIKDECYWTQRLMIFTESAIENNDRATAMRVLDSVETHTSNLKKLVVNDIKESVDTLLKKL